MPRDSIRLPAAVRASILAHAQQSGDEECCGLLIGDRNRIVRAWPAKNVAAEPRRRYDIDPADHFAAVRAARSSGMDVVGAYHSHPRTAAEPSPTDLAEAHPGLLYVIAGREPAAADSQHGSRGGGTGGGSRWMLRGFRLDGANFDEIGLVEDP